MRIAKLGGVRSPASSNRLSGRCTRTSIQVGSWNFLRLYLLADPSGPPAEEVTIAAFPLADPEGTLAATRGCQNQWGGLPQVPLLHLDSRGDPDVESVLHALECYAGDSEPAVRLSVP